MDIKLKNSLLLVGFMGAGKSTVGQLLAKRCHLPFIDTDDLISARFGLSIADIFLTHGEAEFRKVETSVLEELLDGRKRIIATGGGIVLNEENWQCMRQIGPVVFLHATVDDLRDRLCSATGRPLADNSTWEEVTARYRHRLPLYSQADLVIETASKCPTEIVNEIVCQLERLEIT